MSSGDDTKFSSEYVTFWDKPNLKDQHALIAGNVPWDRSEAAAPFHWKCICTEEIEKHLKPGDKVLELGCGIGRMLKHIQDKYTCIGVDISKNMLAQAEEYLGKSAFPRHLLQAAPGDIPVPDFSIDFLYSFLVFQHMPTLAIVRKTINEIVHALRPGGFTRVQTTKGQPHSEKTYGGMHGHWFPTLEEFETEFRNVGLVVTGTDSGLGHPDWIWVTARKE
jgi:ubiquinone/menaquinone biosynthesis C-methylase UbiE